MKRAAQTESVLATLQNEMLDLTADGLRVREELDGVRGDLSAARAQVSALEGEIAKMEDER